MKSLFIVTTYAPTADKQKLLVNCINNLRAAEQGFDIMIVSHASLPEHIIEMADFFVYDKDNRFSNCASTVCWKKTADATIYRLAKYSHEYPIVRLVRNGLGLAKENGYEYFFMSDFDNLYSKEDIDRFVGLRDAMVITNKSFIFFYDKDAVMWTVDGVTLRGVYYDTSLLGGKVQEYLDTFNQYFPKTLEEYNNTLGFVKSGRPQCLEHYFYAAFKDRQEDSLIIKGSFGQYVKSSSLNNSGFLSTICLILPADNGKNYLYMTNDNKELYTFKVYFDSLFVGEYTLSSNDTYVVENTLKLLPLDMSCIITVEVYTEQTLVNTSTLIYDSSLTEKYREDGHILLHKAT